MTTEPYKVAKDLQDLFLYSGKHRPEMYLDQEFRKGISTFSSLADSNEVEEGCRRLEEDVRSGRIQRVMGDFRNIGGDYVFLIANLHMVLVLSQCCIEQ